MEISITNFGFGGTCMLVLGFRVLCTLNNLVNFNIGNKILKKCALFVKSYILQVKNNFPKITILKVGHIA